MNFFMKRVVVLLLCLFSICASAQVTKKPITNKSGYEITVNLKNCNDTLAYLTFYQFDKTFIKDTCNPIKNPFFFFPVATQFIVKIFPLPFSRY